MNCIKRGLDGRNQIYVLSVLYVYILVCHTFVSHVQHLVLVPSLFSQSPGYLEVATHREIHNLDQIV